MEKIFAFAGAVFLSTSTAALATGMSESSGAAVAAQPAAAIAAADTKNGIKANKTIAFAAKTGAPDADRRDVAMREEKPLDSSAKMIPASYEPGQDAGVKSTAELASKTGDETAYTPFSAIESYEVPVSVSTGMDGEAMGGPLDLEEQVAEQWSEYDADGGQGLDPLKFANWAAADTGKAEFGAEAVAQRDSAAPGTATVRLLNATSLEFTYADTDGDMRISSQEMVGYMQA